MSNVSPIEWINDYTVVAEFEGDIEEGDRFTVPSRDTEIDTLREKIGVWVGRLFTPENEYYNIHLEKDSLTAEVISLNENKCVLEVKGTLKYYGTKSISERVT